MRDKVLYVNDNYSNVVEAKSEGFTVYMPKGADCIFLAILKRF